MNPYEKLLDALCDFVDAGYEEEDKNAHQKANIEQLARDFVRALQDVIREMKKETPYV